MNLNTLQIPYHKISCSVSRFNYHSVFIAFISLPPPIPIRFFYFKLFNSYFFFLFFSFLFSSFRLIYCHLFLIFASTVLSFFPFSPPLSSMRHILAYYATVLSLRQSLIHISHAPPPVSQRFLSIIHRPFSAFNIYSISN